MHNPEWKKEVARRLQRSGCPTSDLARLLRELDDHWADLIAEGREAGLNPAGALEYASARLGSAEELAERCIRTRQTSDWWGRHPGLLFGVAPLIVFLLSAAGAALLLTVVGSLNGWWDRPSKLTDDTWMVLTMMVPLFYFALMTAIPVLICRLTGYYCRGWPWALLACASLSLHSYFHHLNVNFPMPGLGGSVVWGYGISSDLTRNLWAAAPPLMIFLFYFLRTHPFAFTRSAALRRSARAAALGTVLAGMSTATLHAGDTVHSRAWIGGEYALAKKTRFVERRDLVRAFPSELRNEQRAGIFVRSVPAHSPAAQSGLEAGDLILRVDDEKMESLRAFRKAVDRAAPAQSMDLSIWRDGVRRSLTVIVGREDYRNIGTIGFGLHFSSKLDLWPNPDFSIFVVGYDRREERTELHSAESRFIRRVRELEGEQPDPPLSSPEGWKATLALFRWGGHKRILSQQPVSATAPLSGIRSGSEGEELIESSLR